MGFVDRLKGVLHMGKASPEGQTVPVAPTIVETRTVMTPAAAEAHLLS